MQQCWRLDIVTRRPDIMHATMLFCLEASPKLNEIIACNRYCRRDLRSWGELNAMCQKKFEFFDRLINEHNLDIAEITSEAWRTGNLHLGYAKFGLKPHFMDLYVQQFIGLLARFSTTENYDHAEAVAGFTILLTYMVEIMNQAYLEASADRRIAMQKDELRQDQDVDAT